MSHASWLLLSARRWSSVSFQLWHEYLRPPSANWLDLSRFGLRLPHLKSEEKPCAEMAIGTTCIDHHLGSLVRHAYRPVRETYSPENLDDRFVQPPERLLQSQLPLVEAVVSTDGTYEIAAVRATFLACDDEVATRCAHALRVIPPWMNMAALPRPQRILSPRVERVYDRSAILHSASASLDRIWTYEINDAGQVAAHSVTNVRVTDLARNIHCSLSSRSYS